MRDPLLDKDFLVELDGQHNKEVFAKAIALDFKENPIEEVTGRITQGSISIDGNSAVRRTCSLTMVASELNIHEYYWGLNTKFKLQVGLRNNINDDYPDIIWFSEGVYVITSFSTSQSTSAYTISLQGKDKMAMLNGDLGGTITALSVDFGKYDSISADGSITTKDYLLKNIITEAVHEYAKEPFQNIIVNDLDDVGVELLEYRGSSPMYLIVNNDSDLVDQFTFKEDQGGFYDYDETDAETAKEVKFTDDNFKFDKRIEIDIDKAYVPTYLKTKGQDGTFNTTKYSVIKAEKGDVIGYRSTDLTYAGDLISNVGESVTSMLDKIKSMLGEYEYFYNLDGQFVFQRKKTYVQSTWNNIVRNTDSETYVENAANTSSITYYFENANIVTSFNNSPDLSNLKNDYSIWGERTSVSGSSIPVHLRYAIDQKPLYYKTYDGITYCSKNLDLTSLKSEIRENITAQVLKRIYNYTPAYGVLDGMDAPTQNEDGSWTAGWWDIRDWYEYYKTVTLGEPNGTMKWYSSNDINGCVLVDSLMPFALANGYSGISSTLYGKYIWLVTINPKTKYISIGHNNTYSSPTSGNTSTCTFYTSELDEDGKIVYTITDQQKDFIAPYNGCSDNHTYLYFLKNEIENGNLVYFYNPSFYFASSYDVLIETELEKEITEYETENLKIVDWREIIYQMSQDYKKHMHDDDFYVTIAENNLQYYPDGYTGYEQYYTDMDGFWRQLYDPFYTSSYHIAYVTKSRFEDDPSDYYLYIQCVNSDDWNSSQTYYNQSLDGTYNKLTGLKESTFKSTPDAYYYLYQCTDTDSFDRNAQYYTKSSDEYDPDTGWNMDVYEAPETLNFWFDFLDTEGELSQYSVHNVGARPKSENDSDVKAIYFRETPNIIFVDEVEYEATEVSATQFAKGVYYTYNKETGLYSIAKVYDSHADYYSNSKYIPATVLKATFDEGIYYTFDEDTNKFSIATEYIEGVNYFTNYIEDLKALKTGYTFLQLPGSLDALFSISSQGKSAVDKLDNFLYNYSYCTESISMTALPVYYLQPNTRIFVRDDNSGINGEYIVTRITLPLTYNGTMNISATKAVKDMF